MLPILSMLYNVSVFTQLSIFKMAEPTTTPPPRWIIERMEFENFKSYAGKQGIGPFHKVSLTHIQLAPPRQPPGLCHIKSSTLLYILSLEIVFITTKAKATRLLMP